MTDHATFTQQVRALVAENDRVPEQRTGEVHMVVIDPEQDMAVSRLWRLLPENLVSIDQLQEALREFAAPRSVGGE